MLKAKNGIPQGLITPITTPFDSQFQPDHVRYAEHAKWLLENGCSALAPFGTTGEANSLSSGERRGLLENLIQSGIDPASLIPGTGCCSLIDTVELTKHAINTGCHAVLMLPPFYYKTVTDDDLYRYFSTVIDSIGDQRLKILLYHIPQVSGISITLKLMERLLASFPDTLAGIKDSSGDWSFTESVINTFPSMSTYSGSEVFLSRNLVSGGSGCITATGNINPKQISAVCASVPDSPTSALQGRLDDVRKRVQALPLIAAIKFVIAYYRSDETWWITRPPLSPLDEQRGMNLIDALTTELNYQWPERID